MKFNNTIKSTRDSNVLISYFSALLLLCTIPPSFAWNNIIPGLAAVMFAVLIIGDIVAKGLNKHIWLPCCFLVLYAIYAFLSSFNFNGFLFILSIPLLFFAKDSIHLDTYKAFKNIFALLLVVSILMYILVVFLNAPISGNEIKPLNEGKTDVFIHYPFLVTVVRFGVVVPRFQCIFDEPGVVGTMCAIILAAEKYNLKDKINYVFLISGILSLSLFFFLICGVYVLLNAKMKYKIIVAILVMAFYVVFADNDILNDLVFQRFIFDDGEAFGDNRSAQGFDSFYEGFRKSPDYLWGLGAGKGELLNEGGSSYKQVIVDFGLIFFLFYMVIFLFLCKFMKMRTKDAIFMLFVISGVMYQRPFVGLLHWSFLLYVSCVYTYTMFPRVNRAKQNIILQKVS